MSEASDKGSDLFGSDPELLVAAVWREAAKIYPDRDTQMEFVNAYISARRRRDEYRREKSEDA